MFECFVLFLLVNVVLFINVRLLVKTDEEELRPLRFPEVPSSSHPYFVCIVYML